MKTTIDLVTPHAPECTSSTTLLLVDLSLGKDMGVVINNQDH